MQKNHLPHIFLKIIFFQSILFAYLWAQVKIEPEIQNHLEQKMRLFKLTRENINSVSLNQKNFDVAYYDIRLELKPSEKYAVGQTRIVAGVIGEELESMEIDLGTHLTVDSVKSVGKRLEFNHQSDIINIALDQIYPNGSIVDIEIFYQGDPSEYSGEAFVFSYYKNYPYIWTLSEPFGARRWWPCKDTPSDKADSVDITVTVPEGLIVASNGDLVTTETTNGKSTFHWRERYPIATYLVSMAIYAYETRTDYFKYSDTDSMPVLSFVLPGSVEVVEDVAQKTIEALGIFSDIFGLYPFINEKYGHAEFGWGGGMEHQTITSLGGWSTRLIVHELAHQWWGDMITCDDFHHIWLNEGFATYSEALYWEAVAGQEAYFEDMSYKRYTGDGTIYVPNEDERSRIFHYGLSYQKSSWVLHMLRHVVGDETFFKILKTYYADTRIKYGSAVTEDFQEVCESVSGMELDWFFEQWIYGEYYPIYFFSWNVESTSSNSATVDLTIEQHPRENYLFKMPVDITFLMGTRDTTMVVWDSLETQKFRIELAFNPTQVLLDPENWIFKELYNQAPHGVSVFLEQNFPNPFYILKKQDANSTNSTIISYQINQTADVKLTIYNLLGQQVRELVNARQIPKYYPVYWDGRNDAGNYVASGVYFYVLDTGYSRISKKMAVVR